jgi:hypothetical protein
LYLALQRCSCCITTVQPNHRFDFVIVSEWPEGERPITQPVTDHPAATGTALTGSGGYSSSTESIGDELVESLVVGTPRKVRTPQAARSNKRGIEMAQVKVLLQDIEQGGGIKKHVVEGITTFVISKRSRTATPSYCTVNETAANGNESITRSVTGQRSCQMMSICRFCRTSK